MDALSLVLPASPVASPGANGADTAASDAGRDGQGFDFATLLAAGLLPQQDPAAALTLAQASGQDAESTAKGDDAKTDASDNVLGALALPLHAGVIAHAASAQPSQTQSGPADAGMQRYALSARQPTAIAANAATIAVAGAAHASSASGLSAERDAGVEEAMALAERARTDSVGELAQSHANAMHMQAPEQTRAASPTALLEVAAPVHTPDFGQALSQQVVWMADKDAQVAEIRINPPELGPVEVRLHVSGDEASVQFVSSHPEVRSAIEASIARLRESMAQAGIQLGQASVSHESFREQTAQYSGGGGQRDASGASGRDIEPAWVRSPIAEGVRRGLVDLFA